MGWIQQEKRRQQGGWVSAMPRPGLASSRGQGCPLVGLVGACCSGCAEGKGCAAKDDPHVHEAVAQRVGAEGLPMSTVTALDAEIQHFNTDVWKAGPNTKASWAEFYPAWNAWLQAVKNRPQPIFGFGFDFIAGENVDAFNALAQRYNLILVKASEEGVQSSAKPYDSASPFEKGLEAAGEGAGSAAAAGLEVVKWTAIAGGVLLVLYFGGPLVLGKLARRGK